MAFFNFCSLLARIISIRLFLALAFYEASNSSNIQKNAFLNDHLKTNIYMDQLEDFTVKASLKIVPKFRSSTRTIQFQYCNL